MSSAQTQIKKKKLKHKFISRTRSVDRLNIEPLNFPIIPPATEITRSFLSSTNKGNSLFPYNRQKGRPENTRTAQNITTSPNQKQSNCAKQPNKQK